MTTNAKICSATRTVFALTVSLAAPHADASPRKAQRTHTPSGAVSPAAPFAASKTPANNAADPTALGNADDETLPPPFNLPAAPRSRMRACGEKWQSMKMAGEALDQTWREFATTCLTSRTEGEKDKSP